MTDDEIRWAAHAREHELLASAVDAAFAAVTRERALHVDAHLREHLLQSTALDKAERATEIRFAGVNQFREQLREQATRLATQERVETLERDLQRRLDSGERLSAERYEANRSAIVAIEKLDVKGEGRQLGQGAVIAAIVGTVGFAATFLGLIIVVANLLTAKGGT